MFIVDISTTRRELNENTKRVEAVHKIGYNMARQRKGQIKKCTIEEDKKKVKNRVMVLLFASLMVIGSLSGCSAAANSEAGTSAQVTEEEEAARRASEEAARRAFRQVIREA